MAEQSSDQIHGTVGEQTSNVAIGKDITQVNVTFAAAPGPEKATAATRRAYLHWLIDRNLYLDPRGTQQTQRQVQLKLNEVYISLRAQAEESQSKADRRLLEQETALLERELAGLPADEQEDRRDQLYTRLGLQYQKGMASTTPIDLDEAVTRHAQLVILGDPGSGKTTLLRYLALRNAVALDSRSETTDEHQLIALFPILVRIAEYAEERAWKGQALSDFLPTLFTRLECKPPGLADLLQRELAQGGCLILLDGLDEIVDADDRRGVVQRIEAFMRSYDQGGRRGENRFIVTSRIAGYRSAPLTGSGGTALPHYVVQEMDDSQIRRFLERWCRAVEDFQTPDLAEETRQATAQREIDGIMNAVERTPGVRRLASNPLMLRVLALIHRTGARLPQKRIELYRLAADTLARTWRTAQGVPESALISENNLTPLLGELAYWMHEHKPTGIATEREVYTQLGAAFAKRKRLADWDPDDPDPAVTAEIDKFLLAVREHTGLFVERAPKRYGFMHLTFEEYYAARHLVARSRTRAQLIRQHLHDSRWEEPILLALGFVGLDYPDEAAELVETAILAQGEEAEALRIEPSAYETVLARDYLFALRCLGDEIPIDQRFIRNLFQRLRDELLYRSGKGCFQHHRQLLAIRLEHLRGSETAQLLARLLLPALHHKDSDVRDRAAHSLRQLGQGSAELVASLLTALRDEDNDVRDQAANSLVQLGQYLRPAVYEEYGNLWNGTVESLGQWHHIAEAVIAGLVAALRNENTDVRYIATDSLGQLGHTSEPVIVGLLAALRDEDSNVRDKAAWSLGQLGHTSEPVIVGLLAALRDEDSDVRYHAAWSLGQLGHTSEPVIVGLLAALYDEVSDVRYSAAWSLGQLDHTSGAVVTGLLATLCDEDGNLRYRAAWSLVQLVDASEAVLAGLLAALYHENTNVRYSAVWSLGQLGYAGEDVVVGLLAALHDKDSDVRYRAAASLSQLGYAGEDVVAGLLAALHDEDSDVRYSAVWSLGQLGYTGEAVVTGLLAALHDEDSDVRYRAAASLSQLDYAGEAMVASLLAALSNENNSLRYIAAKSLSQLGHTSEAVVSGLLAALRDEDSDVWYIAAKSLGQLSHISEAVVADLLAVLRDENSDVRYRAECLLGQLSHTSEAVVAGLLAVLRDEESYVRYQAAWILSQLGHTSEAVVAGLLAALRDEDSYVRYRATESLGQLVDAAETVVTGLLAALRDEDSGVRRCAAWILGQLNYTSEAMVAGLLAALRDEDSYVGYLAASSLGQLGNTSEAVVTTLLTVAQGTVQLALRLNAVQLVGLLAKAEIAAPVLLQGLLDEDDNVRTACGAALAQLAKRFPARKIAIGEQLVQAMQDPVFEKEDKVVHRSGQDYAHEALWQVVAG